MVDSYAGYDTAHTRAAVGQRGPRGWLRVSGRDAVSFLHGILTNDIAGLRAGQWCYAAYLTPQGRMVSDMRVLRREGELAIEMEPHVAEKLGMRFDASIFTEQVQILPGEPWTAGESVQPALTQSVVTCGPSARMALASVLGDEPVVRDIGANDFRDVRRDGERLVLIGHEDLGVPAVDACGSPAACEALTRDLLGAGAAELGASALEALRIEAGTPRFGIDMTEDTIPLEAGIEARAISMTKGCYVGQEVIIRILHRGHGRVARRLVGLNIQGTSVPAPGSPLAADGRRIGVLTSAAFSPQTRHAIALGYVQRDVAEPGTAVMVEGTTEPASVVALPFAAPFG